MNITVTKIENGYLLDFDGKQVYANDVTECLNITKGRLCDSMIDALFNSPKDTVCFTAEKIKHVPNGFPKVR